MGKRKLPSDTIVRGAPPPSKLRDPPHIRAIQDRTIDMLFEGANRKNFDLDRADPTIRDNNTCQRRQQQQRMKQMRIDSRGGLFFSGFVEEPHDESCAFCKSPATEYGSNCSYCDVTQCSSCAKQCHVCNMPTCERCSIANYSHCGEPVCLSCCR